MVVRSRFARAAGTGALALASFLGSGAPVDAAHLGRDVAPTVSWCNRVSYTVIEDAVVHENPFPESKHLTSKAAGSTVNSPCSGPSEKDGYIAVAVFTGVDSSDNIGWIHNHRLR